MVRFAATAALALATSAATAQITSEDDAIFGVDSITRDAAQQLDFLDITISQGRAVNDVANQFGTGGDFENWRYATQLEVATLVNSAGFDPMIEPGQESQFINESPGMRIVPALQELVGITFISDPGTVVLTQSFGATADLLAGGSSVALSALSYSLGPSISTSYIGTTSQPVDAENPRIGHWLVRPVPAPSAAALLGVGGIAAARRRR